MTTANRQQLGNWLQGATLMVVLLVFGWQVLIVNPHNADIQASLQESQVQTTHNLVQSCIAAGDPQRHALIGILRDEIQQSQQADLEKFFPTVPPDQLRTLIRQANKERKRRIAQLQAIPSCRERFK